MKKRCQHCALCKQPLTPEIGYKKKSGAAEYAPYCRPCNRLVAWTKLQNGKSDDTLKQYLKELQFRVSWTLELMRRRGIKPERR